MFDLEQHLRQWRRELEATLAFSSEEIDELEDHLRFSFEAKLKDGNAPEKAWAHCLGDLGTASALALEFAKDKLMPALGRLLVAWWKPALLMLFFSATFYFSFPKSGQWVLDGTLPPGLWAPLSLLTGLIGLSLITTIILLPEKIQKNAVLAGTGNALCLVPLLNVLFYNSLVERFVGIGWSHSTPSFGWISLTFSIVGLFVFNGWWWWRSRTSWEKFPAMSAIATAIALILTASPFCGKLIGDLSIRALYDLPSAHQIPQDIAARDEFLKFEFVAVLIQSMLFIDNYLPLILTAIVSISVVVFQLSMRRLEIKTPQTTQVFPGKHDLPWILILITSGLCWVINSLIEPGLSGQIRLAVKSISLPGDSHGGTELMVLCSAVLFLIAAYELARRLRSADRVRLFYASMLVAVEVTACTGALLINTISNAFTLPNIPPFVSSQPSWLSWILGLTVALIVLPQIRALWLKKREAACETSIWRFDGKDLVQFGLLLGLILACSGLLLWMVALDMAYVSVTFISALIAWGNSIAKPATGPFHPQDYGFSHDLTFWIVAGLGYGCLCLALGLGAAIILSALEFIRFNSFRLYKIRKVRQGMAEDLIISE